MKLNKRKVQSLDEVRRLGFILSQNDPDTDLSLLGEYIRQAERKDLIYREQLYGICPPRSHSPNPKLKKEEIIHFILHNRHTPSADSPDPAERMLGQARYRYTEPRSKQYDADFTERLCGILRSLGIDCDGCGDPCERKR